MHKPSALITGGAGFIGSHLTELLLAKGYTITVLDSMRSGRISNLKNALNNQDLRIVKADIRNKNDICKHFENIDYVFHLAGVADIVPSIENPKEYFEINVDGTFNVLECCRENKIKKIVYAASSTCYGLPANFPTSENEPLSPQFPYALTKLMGEELVMHWERLYKMPAISLRLFNVYGPRSRTTGTYGAVFGVFLKQKLSNQPFTVVGDGSQTRDFTYVSDVANAFLTAAESSISGEIINVGSGGHYSINYLVSLLQGDAVNIPKRPGEPDCTFADTKKILSILNWKPKISFEEGVKNLIESIDDFKDAPLWDPSSIAEATSSWFKYLSNPEEAIC